MNFAHAVGFQLKNMVRRKEFYFAFLVSLCLIFFSTVFELAGIYKTDVLNLFPAWIYFGFSSYSVTPVSLAFLQIFAIFALPFLASLAYSDCCFNNYRDGLYKLLLPKFGRRQYYASCGTAVFLSSFLLIFIPFLLREAVFLIAVPANSTVLGPNSPLGDSLFRNVHSLDFLALNLTYVFYFLYCLIPGLTGGCIALLSFSISLFYHKNRFLVLTLPGILYLACNFLLPMLGVPQAAFSSLILPPRGIRGLVLTPLLIYWAILLLGNIICLECKIHLLEDEL